MEMETRGVDLLWRDNDKVREGGLGKVENNKHLYSSELSYSELDVRVQGISTNPRVVI